MAYVGYVPVDTGNDLRQLFYEHCLWSGGNPHFLESDFDYCFLRFDVSGNIDDAGGNDHLLVIFGDRKTDQFCDLVWIGLDSYLSLTGEVCDKTL